jgi:hypothetical protein
MKRSDQVVVVLPAWIVALLRPVLDPDLNAHNQEPTRGAAPSRLAVSIRVSVMSDVDGMVPTGGELAPFEAVGRARA